MPNLSVVSLKSVISHNWKNVWVIEFPNLWWPLRRLFPAVWHSWLQLCENGPQILVFVKVPTSHKNLLVIFLQICLSASVFSQFFFKTAVMISKSVTDQPSFGSLTKPQSFSVQIKYNKRPLVVKGPARLCWSLIKHQIYVDRTIRRDFPNVSSLFSAASV